MAYYSIRIRVCVYMVHLSGVYGSVGQKKASKPEIWCSTLGSSCFYLVFIKNLKTIKQKIQEKNVLFVQCTMYIPK